MPTFPPGSSLLPENIYHLFLLSTTVNKLNILQLLAFLSPIMIENMFHVHIWCSTFVEWINHKQALKKNHLFFSQHSHLRIAGLSLMRKFPIVLNTLYYRVFLKKGNQGQIELSKFYLWAPQDRLFKLWNLVKSPNDIFTTHYCLSWVPMPLESRLYYNPLLSCYLSIAYHPDKAVSNSREVEIHLQWLLKNYWMKRTFFLGQ